jgi:hypothetical protein
MGSLFSFGDRFSTFGVLINKKVRQPLLLVKTPTAGYPDNISTTAQQTNHQTLANPPIIPKLRAQKLIAKNYSL